MFDSNDQIILKVGKFDNPLYKQHTVVLAEGERIVGIASFNNRKDA